MVKHGANAAEAAAALHIAKERLINLGQQKPKYGVNGVPPAGPAPGMDVEMKGPSDDGANGNDLPDPPTGPGYGGSMGGGGGGAPDYDDSLMPMRKGMEGPKVAPSAPIAPADPEPEGEKDDDYDDLEARFA